MCFTPDVVGFADDGKWIYVKKTDCPLVDYWARRHQADETVALAQKARPPIVLDPGEEFVASMAPGSEIEGEDTVWVVPSSTMGAFREASLIKRLVFAVSAKDNREIRRGLSEIGYPDDILDTVPSPSA